MNNLFTARINKDFLKTGLKHNRSLIIFYSIFLFISWPLVLIITKFTSPVYLINEINVGSIPHHEILTVMMICAMILSVITPLIVFNYINSKRAIDVYHAIPIKRVDLMLTQGVCTILTVLIPFSISYFSGFSIYYLFGGKLELGHIINYLQVLAVNFGMMSIILFVIMNTGTLSDTLIYTAIAIITPFFAYGAIIFFSRRFIPTYGGPNGDFISFLSPLAGLFQTMNSVQSPGTTYDPGIYASYWFVVGLIITAVSFNLYKNMKSELSETSFLNTWFFPTVITAFTSISLFFFTSIFSDFPNNITLSGLVLPIALSFLIFLFLYLVKERSLTNIFSVIKRFVVLVMVTLALTLLTRYTLGYGYATYIPKTSKIASVELTSAGSLPFIENIKKIDEPDKIDEVISLHRELINDLKEERNLIPSNVTYVYNQPTQLYISYILNSGRKVSRSFNLPIEKQRKVLDIISTTELIKTNTPYFSASNSINRTIILDDLALQVYSYTGDVSKLKELYLKNYKENIEGNVLQAHYVKYFILTIDNNSDISDIIPITQEMEDVIKLIDNNHITGTTLLDPTSSLIVPSDKDIPAMYGYSSLAQFQPTYLNSYSETTIYENELLSHRGKIQALGLNDTPTNEIIRRELLIEIDDQTFYTSIILSSHK